ncbi:MAG TPA: hypothetical protein VJR30_11405 [Bradyrhizobium sp.]|nr:hypothetical protein [Bradyrhizobium sp.]
MSEWIAIAQWEKCRELSRPGIIFEIGNAEGKSLFTPCVMPLPSAPFGWKSPPLRFRAVPEPAPERSAPIPPPKR